MAKQSWADKARSKSQAAATKAASRSGGNGLEWTPDIGNHKIRILPPLDIQSEVVEKDGTLLTVGAEDMFFYGTHSYHFLDGIGNEGKGKLLWTPKKFNAETGEGLHYHGHTVKTKSDPIDECVSQLYDEGRKNDDKALQAQGGRIKRKRQFFFNIILLDEEDPEKRFRVLVDKTNEGKLARKICEHMGFPFYRDIEDEWVIKESLELDEDRNYYDLVDIDEGYDFKIVKEKVGSNPWDISYEKSMPITKASRALNDDEKALLEKRTDLRNYVSYSNFDEVNNSLKEYFGEDEIDEDVAETPAVDKDAEAAVKAKAAKAQVAVEEDENMDDLLDDLDDE